MILVSFRQARRQLLSWRRREINGGRQQGSYSLPVPFLDVGKPHQPQRLHPPRFVAISYAMFLFIYFCYRFIIITICLCYIYLFFYLCLQFIYLMSNLFIIWNTIETEDVTDAKPKYHTAAQVHEGVAGEKDCRHRRSERGYASSC